MFWCDNEIEARHGSNESFRSLAKQNNKAINLEGNLAKATFNDDRKLFFSFSTSSVFLFGSRNQINSVYIPH